MIERDLMQSIKTKWGELLHGVAGATSIPESFLAALVANESGGNEHATRFEPKVFGDLTAVLTGAKSSFGSIGQSTLLVYALPDSAQVGTIGDARAELRASIDRLRALATSWGLTQVMGYNAIDAGDNAAMVLFDPHTSLPRTVKLLTQFAATFHLDLTADFEEMLRCWNTGQPHGKTFDPAYVPNGLGRKAIYESL